ncbi:MAG: class I SAM-dependent methyltransferase [Clostridia bacterium]|nr:class I SAM-dependent methyltransferase [Clostridia bacterium]
MDVIDHYDLLIEEGNDPFRDPPALQDYMNQWDGALFLDSLNLTKSKSVLEIGVGTGRIAVKVAPYCKRLVGVDISPKTIERAKENLRVCSNVSLVCADFNLHPFNKPFDIIYSSLTMMHFEDKQRVISKVDSLLNKGGVFCLSIDKNQSPYIDMGTRKIKIYPDTPASIKSLIGASSMTVTNVYETNNAYIIVSKK